MIDCMGSVHSSLTSSISWSSSIYSSFGFSPFCLAYLACLFYAFVGLINSSSSFPKIIKSTCSGLECDLNVLKFSWSIYTTCLILKIALKVLFFLKKQSLTRPSHSMKLMGGGGYLGSILTTLDSTLGGGLKLFLDTFIRWSTLASS